MSEWSVQVVEVGKITKHPNADTLSITNVWGYPVIIRTGEFQEGDRAVYVPVDSVVPDTEQFNFLAGRNRIRAKKLRGIFSMGLLIKPPDSNLTIGTDVAELMGIKKHEEVEDAMQMRGDVEHYPNRQYVRHYDIEGFRKYSELFQDGEEVIVTEKIHGCNARFVYDEGRIWCGSKGQWKKDSDGDVWWRANRQYGLEEKLKHFPNMVLYGEIYGWIQDLRYGAKPAELFFAAFDVYDMRAGQWFDIDQFTSFISQTQIPMVPVLYKGVFKKELMELSDGPSMINAASHHREGIVIKPIKERFDQSVGRVILKLHGETYLLNK